MVHLTKIGWVQSEYEQVQAFSDVCRPGCMSKDFLGFIFIHTAIKGNIGGNMWFVINFTSKKHKIRKIGYFQLASNSLKSLHIYHNQQYIVSTDHK